MLRLIRRIWMLPFNVFCRLARQGYLNWMPDAPFLRIQYFLKLGRILSLAHPQLYNEKLQWIKLFDRKPEYNTYADKLAVRDYVRAQVGEDPLIPLIAAYDRVEDIDWDALPERFVMKCTHGSGANIICTDKSKLDVKKSIEKLEGWMHWNWFQLSREWPYKDIPPRIIVEEFIGTKDGRVPFDYKLMCFEGTPSYIVVDADRYTGHTRNFYDTNWVKQDMFNRHPNIPYEVERPAQLDEMLALAKKLCQGIHHIRIDLYVVEGKVYFGEMTFFHGYGMEVYRPKSFERSMGECIKLQTGEAK